MLSSGIPWNMPRVTCIFRIHTSLYYNYFIPCLNLRKTYGNFGKSSEISANFRKLRKRFKPVFEELKQFMKLLENFGNSSKMFSRCFYDLLNCRKIFGSVRKSSEIFGKLRKRFKSNFQVFYDFFKFSENFRKSSEVFGNFRKRFLDVIRNVRNCS